MNTSTDSLQPDSSNERFFIDAWDIEPGLNRLTKEDHAVQLEPKVMEVLTVLAQAGGGVISKEILLKQVWKDTVVSEEVVSRAISELRKVFNDTAREQRVIETIRKKGYRLAVPVVRGADRISSLDGVSSDGMDTTDGLPARTLVMDMQVNPLSLSEDRPSIKRKWPRQAMVPLVIALTAVLGVVIYLAVAWRTPLNSLADISAQSSMMLANRVRPFTSERGREINPRFSPDGTRVVYASDPENGWNFDLYIRTVGVSASAVPLATSAMNEEFAAWAPSSVGPLIAYSRVDNATCEIVVHSLVSRTDQVVATCAAEVNGLAWSPDGRYLVFSENEHIDGSHWLTLVDRQTGSERSLTTLNEDTFWGDVRPRFSPDGSEIAFIRYIAKGIQEIYVVPTEGGEERQITSDRGSIIALEWESDGEHLMISSDRDGEYGLWRLDLDGEIAGWVAAGGEDAQHFDVSEASRRLVFERWTSGSNLWMCTMGADGACSPEQMLSSTRRDEYPEVSPDRRSIAFKTFRTGEPELWVADMEGGGARAISRDIRPLYAAPAWSPDNRNIAFDSRISGNSDVYIVNLETDQAHRFTMNTSNEISPSWSPSGEWVYFGSDRTGCWRIWRRSVLDGTEEQVTSTGGHSARVSPDGQYLFYLEGGKNGLWRKVLPDGDEELILESFQYSDGNTLGFLNDKLYLIQRHWGEENEIACEGNCLYLMDPATLELSPEPTRLPGPPDAWYKGLSFMSDSTFIFSLADVSTSDLLLIEW